jgi:hypothetical protein
MLFDAAETIKPFLQVLDSACETQKDADLNRTEQGHFEMLLCLLNEEAPSVRVEDLVYALAGAKTPFAYAWVPGADKARADANLRMLVGPITKNWLRRCTEAYSRANGLSRYARPAYEVGPDGTVRISDAALAAARRDAVARVLSSAPVASKGKKVPVDLDQHKENEVKLFFPARDAEPLDFLVPVDFLRNLPASTDVTAQPTAHAPIDMSQSRLLEVAAAMDAVEPGCNYAGRVARVEFEWAPGVTPERIDGLVNVAAPTGSGKTTVAKVITYAIARPDDGSDRRKSSWLVPDTQAGFALAADMRRLGLDAVVITGRTNAMTYHATLEDRLFAKDGLDALSASPDLARVPLCCPLSVFAKGVRGREKNQSFKSFGELPSSFCEYLTQAREGKAPQQVLCPLWSHCPSAQPWRDLDHADVIIVTAQALMKMKVPSAVAPGGMTLLEWLHQRVDLLVVDEVDHIQTIFDGMWFSKFQITGKDEDLINKIVQWQGAQSAKGHSGLNDDRQRFSKEASRLNLAMMDLLCVLDSGRFGVELDHLFNRIVFITDLLGNGISSLLGHGYALGGKADEQVFGLTDRLHKLMDARDTAEGERAVAIPVPGLSDEVLQRVDEAFMRLRSWGTGGELSVAEAIGVVEEMAKLLPGGGAILADDEKLKTTTRLLLAAWALSHFLRTITYLLGGYTTPVHQEVLKEVGRFETKDYAHYQDRALTGPIYGVRLDRFANRGDSTHIYLMALDLCGRSLLMQLDDLFACQTGRRVNVLTMSGTHMLHFSPRYYFRKPIDLALTLGQEDVDRLGLSTGKFLQIDVPDASGTLRALNFAGKQGDDRRDEMRRMVKAMVEDGHLDRILGNLEEGRQRALVFTNKIEDAHFLKDAFVEADPELSDKVSSVRGANDDEDDALGKGDLEGANTVSHLKLLFAARNSLSRAVNMVDEDGNAAFGAILFMQSPHPTPDDTSIATSALFRETTAFYGAAATGVDERVEAGKKESREAWLRFKEQSVEYVRSIASLDRRVEEVSSLAVEMAQIIGRGLRGGKHVAAYFLDGAFYQREAKGERGADNIASSPMVLMHSLLLHACDEAPEVMRQCFAPLMAVLESVHDDLRLQSAVRRGREQIAANVSAWRAARKVARIVERE